MKPLPPGTTLEIICADRTNLWTLLAHVPGEERPRKLFESANLGLVEFNRDRVEAGQPIHQTPDTYQWKVEHGIDPTKG